MFQLRFHQCSLDNQCLRRTIGRRHCRTHAILVYGDAAQRGLRLQQISLPVLSLDSLRKNMIKSQSASHLSIT